MQTDQPNCNYLKCEVGNLKHLINFIEQASQEAIHNACAIMKHYWVDVFEYFCPRMRIFQKIRVLSFMKKQLHQALELFDSSVTTAAQGQSVNHSRRPNFSRMFELCSVQLTQSISIELKILERIILRSVRRDPAGQKNSSVCG